MTFSQPDPEVSWNQFRGPERTGSIEYELSYDWAPEGPELVWKKPIGSAFSEIAVVGDRIYSMMSEQIDSTSGWEYLVSYDGTTGTELWRNQIDSLFFDQFGNGPRSTPLVAANRIFCLSSYGKLSAHERETGNRIWQVDLIGDFESTLPRWAYSTSPILVGEALILEAGGTDDRGFIGIDQATGDLLWTNGQGIAGYSSPVVAEMDGKTHVIFTNQTTLYAFNEKGDTLWTHAMSMNGPMASPVVFDENKIFISTVRSHGFSIVEVKDGKVSEILKAGTMKNDFSSSVVYNGYIYGFDVAALQCVSAATGEKKWTKRGLGKGSLIRVGDQLLVLSDKGKLVVIEATPELYQENGSFQALEGKSWTAPSFSEGKLYVRNLTEMACYRIK
jgi:outer membrane protein assembly factor BamB